MGIDHFWTIFNMGAYGDNMMFYGFKLGSMAGEGSMGLKEIYILPYTAHADIKIELNPPIFII